MHLVLSIVGGSGVTKVSVQLCEALNALALDANTTHRDLARYMGISHLNKEEAFFSKCHSNIEEYAQYVMGQLMRHFKECENCDPVVVDFGTLTGFIFLDDIVSSMEFGLTMERLGVKVFFHIVIPSIPFDHGEIAVTYLMRGKTKEQIADGSVIVWINEYRDSFLENFNMEEAKNKINDKLGDAAKDIVILEKPSELTKRSLSNYLQSITFGEFAENIPMSCSFLDAGRLRRYDQNFKIKIRELFNDHPPPLKAGDQKGKEEEQIFSIEQAEDDEREYTS